MNQLNKEELYFYNNQSDYCKHNITEFMNKGETFPYSCILSLIDGFESQYRSLLDIYGIRLMSGLSNYTLDKDVESEFINNLSEKDKSILSKMNHICKYQTHFYYSEIGHNFIKSCLRGIEESNLILIEYDHNH